MRTLFHTSLTLTIAIFFFNPVFAQSGRPSSSNQGSAQIQLWNKNKDAVMKNLKSLENDKKAKALVSKTKANINALDSNLRRLENPRNGTSANNLKIIKDIQNLEKKLDENRKEFLRLQQTLQQSSGAYQTISNAIRVASDAARGYVDNLK
ncbi:MAG: hypothetical protein KDC80_12465 [Saprospiraceae bacterium]|nr:hypothetical protein [Saprospiraceae bacterium]